MNKILRVEKFIAFIKVWVFETLFDCVTCFVLILAKMETYKDIDIDNGI